MMRCEDIRWAILNCLLLVLAAPAARAADLGRATELYQKTRYEEVVRLLDGVPGNEASSAYALMGKSYYMLTDYKKATHALEKAIEKSPLNSEYYDWLGKVYCRRAETSSFVTSWSYAGNCRRNFERAVKLDSKNLEAIDDLFEFSLNAPGFIGGGIDKAAAISELARNVDLPKYHSLQARLAEKKKDFAGEEKHLQLALELAPAHLGRIIDMAEFLARRGRYAESEIMFERARGIAPGNAELKFERAKTYIELGRNRQEARKLLQQYLESSLTPDDPPRADAEQLLKQTTRG